MGALCAGCEEQSPRVELLTAEIPQSLRHCKSEPSWDAMEARAKTQQRTATQREVATFVALLADSGRDCRTKLASVNRLLLKVEQRAAAANKSRPK